MAEYVVPESKGILGKKGIGKMLAEKQQAAALTTAHKNIQQHKAYRNSVSASRAKLQIGEILLALEAPLSQEQQKKHWEVFGVMLRQYVDLKYRRAG